MIICQKDCAVTSMMMAIMKKIDMMNMHRRRPIRSATKGVTIEPMILPAVGIPLPSCPD